MSSDTAPIASIPARVTVEQLAAALRLDLTEVQAVLEARAEISSPDDVLGPDLAMAVARALGVPLNVEARDMALEVLYQLETGGEAGDLHDLKGRVGFLVNGVIGHKEELDHEIESAS